MGDNQAFSASAGVGVSNFAVLVLGALIGGVVALKFLTPKRGVRANAYSAYTDQDYISNQVFKACRASAYSYLTVEENQDRIHDLVRRYRVDVNNLVLKLRHGEITAAEYKSQIHALAQTINQQLQISQVAPIISADQRAQCVMRLNNAINRINTSRLGQQEKDRIVAKLNAVKARCNG